MFGPCTSIFGPQSWLRDPKQAFLRVPNIIVWDPVFNLGHQKSFLNPSICLTPRNNFVDSKIDCWNPPKNQFWDSHIDSVVPKINVGVPELVFEPKNKVRVLRHTYINVRLPNKWEIDRNIFIYIAILQFPVDLILAKLNRNPSSVG